MTSGDPTGPETRGRWADLGVRVASAAVLIVLAVVLIRASGVWLGLGVAVLTGAMSWELARMMGGDYPRMPAQLAGWRWPVFIGALTGVSVFLAVTVGAVWVAPLVLLPAIAGAAWMDGASRVIFALFAAAIALAGFGLVLLITTKGLGTVGWIVGCVILSDIAGYFAGKQFGGPKFWPAISPKKTWSGTAAGWLAAAVLGLVLAVAGYAGPGLILLSALVAMAGQAGDIAESWLKRRVGVKDSSRLIPGHGGFMDRFDAMTGAILAALVIWAVTGLPLIGSAG